jgi:N-glycosylase/DNA lyase
MTNISISIINEAVLEVAAHLPTHVRNRGTWRGKPESELWRELVGAILGSAVSFEQAIAALLKLDNQNLTTPSQELGRQQSEIEQCLRIAGYRFPVSRARQIAASASAIYDGAKTLQSVLVSYTDATAARRGLISLCPGIGPKQASLFLRNIGYDDLAVLDRHVLAYLQYCQLISPGNVVISSVQRYEVFERIVANAAGSLGLTVADFDLAVWITVRVIRGNYRQWDS